MTLKVVRTQATKEVASYSTADQGAVEVVQGVIKSASTQGTQKRCTFLEGGEPDGLRFALSTRHLIWVTDAGLAMAQADFCYDVDAAGVAALKAVVAGKL